MHLTRGSQRTEAGARVSLPGSSSSCCHVWSVRRVGGGLLSRIAQQ